MAADSGRLAPRMPVRAIAGVVLMTAGYLGLALAFLRQWGTPHPWSRLDIPAGAFLLLLILGIACDMTAVRPALQSLKALRELTGVRYDPATLIVGTVLGVGGDAAAFFDYGHWHLVPGLEQPWLRIAGLLLAVPANAWLVWTDRRLAEHIAGARRGVIQDGPFRYVRHPRYAGILAIRAAFALVFASAVGWALATAWLMMLLRRIHLEERHLRTALGDDYAAYVERTPRLLPGVY